MTAYFIIDTIGTVWLYYVKDIKVRDNITRKKHLEMREKLQKAQSEAQVDTMKSLEENKKSKKFNSKNVKKIYNRMKEGFEEIKNKLKLSLPDRNTREQSKIDDSYQLLRPNSPFKLTDMLKDNFNPLNQVTNKNYEEKNQKIKLKEFIKNKSPQQIAYHIMNSKPDDPFTLLDDDSPFAHKVKFDASRNRSYHINLKYNRSKLSSPYLNHSNVKFLKGHFSINNNYNNINDEPKYNSKIPVKSKQFLKLNKRMFSFGPNNQDLTQEKKIHLPIIQNINSFKISL